MADPVIVAPPSGSTESRRDRIAELRGSKRSVADDAELLNLLADEVLGAPPST